MLLPGQCAAQVRRRAAELIVRFLGGDLSIISEVMAHRGLQEELAADAPQDPRHAFGEAVEGGPGLGSAVHFLERALPPVLENLANKLFSKIDERFAAMEQRLRPGPCAPAGAGSSKALTIPQYLNEREREHPGFAGIRKRFAPAFNTVVSMLRYAAVRTSGRSYGWKRAAYTEKDRPLLDHAWELSCAYREALAAGRNGPTVLELLGAR